MLAILCAIGTALLASAGVALADDAFGPTATWKPLAATEARVRFDRYLQGKTITAEQQAEIDSIWSAPAIGTRGDEPAGDAPRQKEPRIDLLDRTARSLAVVNPQVKELVAHCNRPFRVGQQPEYPWLLESNTPEFVRNNLRLYYARWLAQQELHDRAATLLAGLEPAETIDPAGLLFYRAIVHHRLVNAKESRQAAMQLLEREADLPRRYQQLAALMTEDLKEIDYDSLDHISRRMNDIERRLDLGQAGEKVRKVEDGVIASLDKLIEQMEDQQQQQQSSAGGPSSPNSKPAENAQVAPLKGAGKVDKKYIGEKSDWGSLPPKQREAALQQIGKEFPAHFRDAIEQYFRKIAGEEQAGSE
jgi:hypothetical protein